MAQPLNLVWAAPGPVAAAFMASRASTQIINGPVGSGKTTTALMKAVLLARQQRPSTQDTTADAKGQRVLVRKFKLCVVRDTYRQLWATTIPSWFKRVPREVGEFVGSQGAPATHAVKFGLADGTVVLMQVDFVAIGENAVEDVLRGYEPTAFYLNELDLLARDVFDYANTRHGRYPDVSEGGPTWHGLLADCNAPELHNWLYRDVFIPSAEKLAGKGIELFRQPGARDPGAENTANLMPDYYPNMVRSVPDWMLARFVDNKPGFSRAGKPCYPEFRDEFHVSPRELAPVPGLRLRIGLDAGLHPAAVLGQRMPNGAWHILDELVGEPGMGPVRFGDALARLLQDRYADCREIFGVADPSARDGADKQAGEQSWIEIMETRVGIRIRPAPTNRLIPRLEAVRITLTRTIDDARPGFVLSPRCETLREGFASSYRFRKMATKDERYDDEPEKNDSSHPHDALQYLLSEGGEDAAVRERKDMRDRAVRRVEHLSEWDPFRHGLP